MNLTLKMVRIQLAEWFNGLHMDSMHYCHIFFCVAFIAVSRGICAP